MNKLFRLALPIAACAALVCSCADSDVYNPNAALEEAAAEYEANWENLFGTIAEDQNWNMAESATATMTIYEDALASYTLRLYTANPISDDDAYLLASYDVTTDDDGYASATFNFDMPSGTTSLYAARRNAKGQYLLHSVDVDNSSISTQFGQSTTRSGITRTGEVEYEIPAYSAAYTTTADVNAYIADMVQVEWDTSLNNYYYDNNTGKGYPKIDGYFEEADGGSIAIILDDGDAFPYFSGYYNTNVYYVSDGTQYVNLKELVFVIEEGATVTCSYATAVNFGNAYCGTAEKITVFIEDGANLVLEGNSGGQVAFGEAYVYNLAGATISGVALSLGNSAYGNTIDYCLWNAGTVNVDGMYLSYAYVDNIGDIIVNGNIQESINSRLINNGYTYCESFGDGSNQDGEVWTNCKFVCTDYCKGSNFRIGCNASISAPDIEVYSQLDLNPDAILYASSQLLMGNCDINGPVASGEHGLIQSPSLYYFCNTEDPISIIGNIYFYYDTMDRSESLYWANVVESYVNENIKAGYDSQLASTTYSVIDFSTPTTCSIGSIYGSDEEEEEEEEEDSTTTTTPEVEDSTTTTTPEVEDSTTTTSEDTVYSVKYEDPITWTIMCEDFGSTDDYDFNDVIFTVTHVFGNNDTIYVTPRAAGGVKKAYIYFNDDLIGEIHELLDATDDRTSADGYDLEMLNTTTGGTPGETIYFIVDKESFSMSENMGGFSVVVEDEEQTVTIVAPTTGTAPQMILVKDKWKWPIERVTINEAYPDFATWNEDKDNTDWINNPVESLIIGNYDE